MFGKGSWYHYVQVGARVTPLETLIVYILPYFFLASLFREWFLWNALCQLVLFIPVVQIPAFLTGHMAYVDIGWPVGLLVLAANAIRYGQGYWLRRSFVGGCMLIHGGRMFFGSLVMFFPYRWKQDLPRYRYAKVRFEGQDGMPGSTWPVKVQHDTLQQAYANATCLACPLMLCAFNPSPDVHPLEIVGFVVWAAFGFVWENIADGQKMLFMKESNEKKLKDAVLGFAPFDGAKYCLWTWCRHPNYFGEWMAWNGFVIMALPSLASLEEPLLIRCGLAVSLWFCSRIFYDCLNFWTGAEPAEHYSVQKRALYREYQQSTRVFFPLELPCVDHCRTPGWPGVEKHH